MDWPGSRETGVGGEGEKERLLCMESDYFVVPWTPMRDRSEPGVCAPGQVMDFRA
jgi:hypothetical protein